VNFKLRSTIPKSPQQIFASIAVIFGILMVTIVPPFQAADEYLHFYRAFQIAEGRFIAERQRGNCYGYSKYFETEACLGGQLPKSILTTVRNVSSQDLRFDRAQKQSLREILALIDRPLDANDRIFINFKTTALHSPISYFPQALGIAVGKIFNLSPLLLMYLGRLVNLSVWVGLVYLAIRWVPIDRWLFVLLALTPMSLFQAASLSVDVLTNGVAFAFVALVLRFAVTETEPGKLPILLLGGFAVVLAIGKLAYLPLVFLLFAIPKRQFKNGKSYWIQLGSIELISLFAVLLWSRVVSQIYISLHRDLSPTDQIQFVLSHPMQFAAIVWRTFVLYTDDYLTQFIGVLGWLDTLLPGWLVVSYWGVLTVAAFVPVPATSEFKLWQRGIFATGALSSMVLLCGLAYLWNVVGADTIGGIQGRYWIPIAPVVGLLVYNRRVRASPIVLSRLFSTYLLFSSTVTLVVLFDRYYRSI